MMPLDIRKTVLAGAMLIAAGSALAQTSHQHVPGMHDSMPQTPSGDMQSMHAQTIQPQAATPGRPVLPGQDAFGAIQEIVQILEADPNTDWSKVDLEVLRQHLIDMNEVTLKAEVAATSIEGGLEIAVTGSGRTLSAIQRMVPAHAREIDGLHGWTVKASSLPNGELLTVTATNAEEVQHVRGLGFIGILASGSHHQPHHLMMAKNEFSHGH
jgi:hypothetical protein